MKDYRKGFGETVRMLVHEHFETNKYGHYANGPMIRKTAIMLSLYFVPYFLMVLGLIQSTPLIALCWGIMGFGMAGIGMGIMHDANHGSYSKNKKINTMLGLAMEIVGANSQLWKIQHNVLHHGYTNIQGYDEDIELAGLMRFSPHQKKMWYHRFQHIYAWILYCFLTIKWFAVSDFFQVVDYHSRGLLRKNLWKQIARLIFWKTVYIGYIIVIPIALLPISPAGVILCVLLMHIIAGFILSVVFQLAHVMPNTDYPDSNQTESRGNDWVVNQLNSTTNFAPNNRFLTWYLGGLNHQVEHHLFTNICHIHYPDIAKIVQRTAAEYNLSYKSYSTFFAALLAHTKMLYALGN